MRPALGALTGVPAGLRKSAPPCGLRGWRLNTLLDPNALLALSGTGRTNGSAQRRSGETLFQICSSSFASLAIRSVTFAGGLTNASLTVRFRVGNFLALTRISCVLRSLRLA